MHVLPVDTRFVWMSDATSVVLLRCVHDVPVVFKALRPEGIADRRMHRLHVGSSLIRILACLSSQVEGKVPSFVLRLRE